MRSPPWSRTAPNRTDTHTHTHTHDVGRRKSCCCCVVSVPGGVSFLYLGEPEPVGEALDHAAEPDAADVRDDVAEPGRRKRRDPEEHADMEVDVVALLSARPARESIDRSIDR